MAECFKILGSVDEPKQLDVNGYGPPTWSDRRVTLEAREDWGTGGDDYHMVVIDLDEASLRLLHQAALAGISYLRGGDFA